MIDRERFEQLAVLAIAGEATPAERAELDAALRDAPELNRELAELTSTDRVLRTAVVPSAPANVIAGLEQIRRETLANRLAADATAAGAKAVVPFPSPAAHPAVASARRGVPGWLALAASILAVAGLAVFFLWPASKAGQAIAVLAPRGNTSLAQPTLVWDNKPGQLYDVWILPAEGNSVDTPALFVVKGVQSPVAFADLKPGPALSGEATPPKALEPGQDYRLLVCLANAGRIAGTAFTFRTALDARAKAPPADLATARKLADAGRPSDALTVLLALPAAERERADVRGLEAELRRKILATPKR